MKTSSCKNKGRKLQQHVVQKVQESLGLKDGDVESRSMGSAGVDILLSASARVAFPISVECKNTKTFPSVSALKQSAANAFPSTLPAVVWKPFGKGMEESIIYFNLGEFLEWRKNETITK